MPNISPSRIQQFQPIVDKPKPQDGEKVGFMGLNCVAFTVMFKGARVTIERDECLPDTTNKINHKFGNRRVIDSQLYEVADMIREYLFKLGEQNT